MNELRRFERRAARRYSHMAISYRRCGVGFCLGCWWRSLSGEHRRVKARMVARGRERLQQSAACEHEWTPHARAGREMPHCHKCGTTRWIRSVA